MDEKIYQSDQTALDIWEVFYDHAIEMEFPDDKFMKKVAILLSKELSPSKVREALNSSPEMDGTSISKVKKDVCVICLLLNNLDSLISF